MDLLSTLHATFGVEYSHPVHYWKALISGDLPLIGSALQEAPPHGIVNGEIRTGKGVQFGPFTFLRGPLYIGNNVRIGPYVELTRCIILDGTTISHKNVIVDSVIGPDVWVAGFTATCNRRLDDKSVQVNYCGDVSDTGGKFGAVIDRGGRIGAGIMLKPGIYVKPKQTIRLPRVNYEIYDA